jgi:hypothetical protein
MNPIPTITWFEIPSTDFNRAVKFYERVFKVALKHEEMDAMVLGIFPYPEGHCGGAVIHGEWYKPQDNGVCIYLYSTDFDGALQRIEENGGRVVMPKTSLGPIGFIAHFIDSEGNRVGLHTAP